MCLRILQIIGFYYPIDSAVPNNRTVWNNRGGYYIGIFGYYIKNHVLFNRFSKKIIQKNNRACTVIRDPRVNVDSFTTLTLEIN